MPSNSPEPTPCKMGDVDLRTGGETPAAVHKFTPSPSGTAQTEALTPMTPSHLETPLSSVSTNPGTAPVTAPLPRRDFSDIALQEGYIVDGSSTPSNWENEWKSRALFPDDDDRARSSSFSSTRKSTPLPPPIPPRQEFASLSAASLPSASRRTSRTSIRRVKSISQDEDLWSSSTLGIAERRRSSSTSYHTSTRSMSGLPLPSEEAQFRLVDVTPATPSLDQSSTPDSSPSSSRDVPKNRRRKPSPSPGETELTSLRAILAYRMGRMRNNKLVLILCFVGVVSLGLTILTNRAVVSFRSDAVMNAEELEEAISRYEQAYSVRVRRPYITPEGGLRGKLVKKAGKQKEDKEKRHSDTKQEDHPGDKDKSHSSKPATSGFKPDRKDGTKPEKPTKLENKRDGPSDGRPDGSQIEKIPTKSESKETKESKGKRSEPKTKDVKSRPESLPSPTNIADTDQENQPLRSQSPLAVIRPDQKLRVKRKFVAFDESMFNTADKPEDSHFPRLISFHEPLTSKTVARMRTVEINPADFTDNTQLYSILDSSDERLSHMEMREPYSDGECVPMKDWQTTFHPFCNGMHEIGLEHMGGDLENDVHLFGVKGYWRNAWRVDTLSHHHAEERDTVVLKTLKFEHNFEDAHFEHDRIDAVAMERLTSSPHVINVFGFCGHSVITEYADGSRVGELADKSRKKPLARLRIARDIANGLADVHGIDGDGNATFVHLDVNPANVVSIGGTLKLNDFNIGIIRRWNTTSNSPCGFPAQYPNPQWRSPEEARNEQNLTEKVDVFSMGHIFFRLICGHEPWNKLEPGGKPSKEEINRKVQKGVLPFIPKDVMKSKDREVSAIRDVMLRCYTFDPKKRPSARDIATSLQQTLDVLTAEQQGAESEIS